MRKGFGLIEVVIGASIISTAFFGLMSVANLSLKILDKNTNNLKAGFLMEEGIEAVKILRDDGWSSNIDVLNNGTSYYLEFTGGTWQASTNYSLIDNFFERRFVLSAVYRDANDDIAASGDLDPGTKKVTIYVSWPGKNGTITQSFSTYISNLFE